MCVVSLTSPTALLIDRVWRCSFSPAAATPQPAASPVSFYPAYPSLHPCSLRLSPAASPGIGVSKWIGPTQPRVNIGAGAQFRRSFGDSRAAASFVAAHERRTPRALHTPRAAPAGPAAAACGGGPCVMRAERCHGAFLEPLPAPLSPPHRRRRHTRACM